MNVFKLCYTTLLDHMPRVRIRRIRWDPAASAFVVKCRLTREELRVLALYWMELYLDSTSWCVQNPSDSATEQALSDYATDRLVLVQDILGRAAFKEIEQEAQSRIGEKLEDTGEDAAGPRVFEDGWVGY